MSNFELSGQNKTQMDICSIKFCIQNIKLVFNKTDEKYVNLIIQNQSKNPIEIPDWLYIGAKDDLDSELVFEIEKKDSFNNKFTSFEGVENHYDYITTGRKTRIIPPGDKITLKQDIQIVSNIQIRGFYRIRATLKLNDISKCSDAQTNWIEFEVL